VQLQLYSVFPEQEAQSRYETSRLILWVEIIGIKTQKCYLWAENRYFDFKYHGT